LQTTPAAILLADFIVEAGHKLADRVIEQDDMSRLVARLHMLIDDDNIDVVILPVAPA
jgi:molybdopterin biosynthesis enzyme MoaB